AMCAARKGIGACQASRARAVGRPPTVAPQERRYQSETVEITLSTRESIEYKYRLSKGDALLYSWTTTDSVNYELHGEPDGAPRGYAESLEKNQGQSASGTLTAPFSG